MTVRRTALLLAPLAVFGLAACEKPAPQVTVATEGRVVNLDAKEYCFEPDKCRTHEPEKKEIRVRRGGQMSINVPTRVAEHGWYFRAGDQSGREIKKLHYVFEIPEDFPAEADFELVQGEPGKPPEGVWSLHVVVKQ